MSKEKQSGGIGFLGLLTIAFIVLKLCAVIDWSWWWVLSPTLIPLGITLLIMLFLAALRTYAKWKLYRK